MSKGRPHFSDCFGKQKHETRTIAAAIVKRCHVGSLGIYRCKACGFWHIGNSKTRQVANQRKREREMKVL